jgi:hypothetical protein
MTSPEADPPGAAKIIAALAALIAAAVARKSLAAAWTAATGHRPPDKPEHHSVAWGEALTWAVVSGALVGVARLVAQKKVVESFHGTTARSS